MAPLAGLTETPPFPVGAAVFLAAPCLGGGRLPLLGFPPAGAFCDGAGCFPLCLGGDLGLLAPALPDGDLPLPRTLLVAACLGGDFVAALGLDVAVSVGFPAVFVGVLVCFGGGDVGLVPPLPAAADGLLPVSTGLLLMGEVGLAEDCWGGCGCFGLGDVGLPLVPFGFEAPAVGPSVSSLGLTACFGLAAPPGLTTLVGAPACLVVPGGLLEAPVPFLAAAGFATPVALVAAPPGLEGLVLVAALLGLVALEVFSVGATAAALLGVVVLLGLGLAAPFGFGEVGRLRGEMGCPLGDVGRLFGEVGRPLGEVALRLGETALEVVVLAVSSYGEVALVFLTTYGKQSQEGEYVIDSNLWDYYLFLHSLSISCLIFPTWMN